MNGSAPLSEALHVLVHLAQRPDVRRTSEEMAAWWDTNPVVIRRRLGQLRDAGLVRSVSGPGGGWSLDNDPAAISLAAIYAALGQPLTGPEFEPAVPTCLVAQAIESLLDETKREVERALLARLEQVSLADLVAEAGTLEHPEERKEQ